MVHVTILFSRVRSVIIVQEKPQDREKLLLKFMKVLRVKKTDLIILTSFIDLNY